MLYAGSGSPIPNDTMEQFRASGKDWDEIEEGECRYDRTIRELRDRVAALEAEQEATCKAGLQVADDLTPEVDPDAPQTLHSVALDMVDSLGRSFHLLPEILDTLRRAIREPMAGQQAASEVTPEPEPSPSPAGDGGAGLVEAVAYAIENQPILGPAPKEEYSKDEWRPEARGAIFAIARWLRSRGNYTIAAELEWEASR